MFSYGSNLYGLISGDSASWFQLISLLDIGVFAPRERFIEVSAP